MIRVTEPLNYFIEPWTLDWYCRVGKAKANRTKKSAMKIGTRVDELIKPIQNYFPLTGKKNVTYQGIWNPIMFFLRGW